jgi:hypothetical protein
MLAARLNVITELFSDIPIQFDQELRSQLLQVNKLLGSLIRRSQVFRAHQNARVRQSVEIIPHEISFITNLHTNKSQDF